MLQSQDNVTCEETNSRLVEALAVVKVEEELPACAVVEHHEHLAVVLKRVVHFNNERVVHFFLCLTFLHYQDFTFSFRVLDLVGLVQVLLLQRLHREHLACVAFPHECHFPVRSTSDDLEHGEGLKCHLSGLRLCHFHHFLVLLRQLALDILSDDCQTRHAGGRRRVRHRVMRAAGGVGGTD